jgi:hypothetical protein
MTAAGKTANRAKPSVTPSLRGGGKSTGGGPLFTFRFGFYRPHTAASTFECVQLRQMPCGRNCPDVFHCAAANITLEDFASEQSLEHYPS